MRVFTSTILLALASVVSQATAAPEFTVERLPGAAYLIRYGGEVFVPSMTAQFVDKSWRSVMTFNSDKANRTQRNGSIVFRDERKDGCVMELAFTPKGNVLRINFSSKAPVETVAHRYFEVFPRVDIMEGAAYAVNRANGATVTGKLTRALPITVVSEPATMQVDSVFGKLRFTVSGDEKTQTGWAFRNTFQQKWRPDQQKSFGMSFVESGLGAQKERRISWEIEITRGPAWSLQSSRRRLKQAAAFWAKHPNRPTGFDAFHKEIEDLPLQIELSAISRGEREDQARLNKLADFAQRISDMNSEGQTDRVLIVPQPKEMKVSGTTCLLAGMAIQVRRHATAEELRGPTVLAEELKAYHGLDAPIVRSDEMITRPAIIIGCPGTFPLLKDLGVAATDLGPEGYALKVMPERILIAGADVRGAFYGAQSLLQLLHGYGSTTRAAGVAIRDWPDMKRRGMQFGLTGDVDLLKRVIRRVAARTKLNFVCFGELASQGMVKWTSMPKIKTRSDALTPAQVSELADYARAHFLEVIPSTQMWGHSREVVAGYPEIGEEPGGPTLCLSNPKTRELLFARLDEIIRTYKPRRYVHVGMDEALQNKACPRCKGLPTHKIVADYITLMRDFVAQRNLKMIMWHDMFLDYRVWKDKAAVPANSNQGGKFNAVTHPALDLIPKDIIMALWMYGETRRFGPIDYFQKKGFQVLCCPWFTKKNICGFAKNAHQKGAWGFMDTTWMFTTWRNPNMMSILALAYPWNVNTPAPDKLNYAPEEVLQDMLQPVYPSLAGKAEPLDLRPWTNLSLRDDQARGNAGWTDCGSFHDLRLLPDKKAVLGAIAFDLNGKCVAVAGKDRKMELPQHVAGIRIDRKAKSLVFLHTCDVRERVRLPVAEYEISYTDGARETAIIHVARDIMSWRPGLSPYGKGWTNAMLSGYVLEALPAWKGRTVAGERVWVYQYEWLNPQPEKTIKSIALRIKTNRHKALMALLALCVVNDQ